MKRISLLILAFEAIAKLLCIRKSMILPPENLYKLSGASWLARAVSTRTCPNGQARRHGENWRQKGGFIGRMSFTIASLFIPFLCGAEPIVLRVGHFPNITHAQAIIAHGLSREGRGWFEKRLGNDVKVEWYVYNAGPSAMEGIFAETLDLAYSGPSPTINAYIKSHGKEIRIISGSCSGGAALVVQPNGQIKTNADFKGKKIATPQFGGTQDIAARAWLKSLGYQVSVRGGDVLVIPTSNPDQFDLFKQGTLDGVWTVEPWVSFLELNADGKIYFEEKVLWPNTNGKYVTAHLVSSIKMIEKHPDLLKKWISAHVELTEWIKDHPEEAKKILSQEIQKETMRKMPEKILDRAWVRLEFTHDPISASLFKYAEEAYDLGFLKEKPNLSLIYDLRFLHEVLESK